MKLGFTGSRHEPTEEQKQFIWRNILDATELSYIYLTAPSTPTPLPDVRRFTRCLIRDLIRFSNT